MVMQGTQNSQNNLVKKNQFWRPLLHYYCNKDGTYSRQYKESPGIRIENPEINFDIYFKLIFINVPRKLNEERRIPEKLDIHMQNNKMGLFLLTISKKIPYNGSAN